MKTIPITSVGDVNTLIARDGMRVDGLSRGDAMFPFLLHLGVHHQ